MLESKRKLYERMILNRIQSELDDPKKEGLSKMQYGFHAGRSTLHAVQKVQKTVYKAGNWIHLSSPSQETPRISYENR